MSRQAARPVKSGSDKQGNGGAYALGWFFFLALVFVTPLAMGVLPLQAGWLAQFRAADSVFLPKVVAILVLSGLSLAALCVAVVRRESELRWHPVMWILVALFIWAGVSTLFSANPARSVLGGYSSNDGLVAIFGYGLVAFLAIQYVRSTSALRTVAVAAVVSGSLVSAYALLQYWGVDPLVYLEADVRVFSTFGNPDMLGNYLVFPLALALGLALSARGTRLLLGWWAATALIAAGMVVSGTRGAWIGASVVALCMVLVGWQRVRDASRRLKIAFVGLGISLTAAAALAIVLTRSRVSGAGTVGSVLAGISNGRTVIWLIGLKGWLAHPIVGWGPDGFGRAFQSAVGPSWYAMVQGLQTAENAHNFLVQVLVALGIPGLVLTMWALAQTGVQSLRGMQSAKGSGRALFLAPWAGLLGLVAALIFGVTLAGVSVWLWLTVGLLLAPISLRSSPLPKAVPAAAAAVGVVVAIWAGSWMVADVISGWAEQQQPGPRQVSAYQAASRLNPLSPDYRWLVAEALANQAFAERRAGQSAETVDATMNRSITAYDSAARADRGDPMVRVALANILMTYAEQHPDGEAARRAVQAASESVRLAPLNPAALVVLARAYEAVGRHDEALKTARLARSVSPAYSMQALGSLGPETTAVP